MGGINSKDSKDSKNSKAGKTSTISDYLVDSSQFTNTPIHQIDISSYLDMARIEVARRCHHMIVHEHYAIFVLSDDERITNSHLSPDGTSAWVDVCEIDRPKIKRRITASSPGYWF